MPGGLGNTRITPPAGQLPVSRDTVLREKMLSRHIGRYRSGLMSAVNCSLRHCHSKFKVSAQESTPSSFTFSRGHACVRPCLLTQTCLHAPMLAHMDMLVCAHTCSRGHACVHPCLLTWTCLRAFMLAHMKAKAHVHVFFSHLATLLVFFPKGAHGVRLPSNLLCRRDGRELLIPCLYLPSAEITRRF